MKSDAIGYAMRMQEKLSFMQERMHMLLLIVSRYLHDDMKC